MYFIDIKFMDTFTGYLRQNGQVGIRNELLILNLTGLTNKIAERVHKNLKYSKLISFETLRSFNSL